MAKKIQYNKQARESLKKGVDHLANAVAVTLGPKGRNVLISAFWGSPRVTKDGVTVAKEVILMDPIENMGASLIKEAAQKAADIAGDGTTTATVLARDMIERGMAATEEGANPMEVKSGMDKAVPIIVEYLKGLSIPIGDDDKICQIATISANNDDEMGKMIGDTFKKIGKEGVMSVEISQTGKTYVERVEGMQFDGGWTARPFVTNLDKMEATYDSPLILIVETRLTYARQLTPLFDILFAPEAEIKPLVIICREIEGEVLASLAQNKVRNGIPFLCIKAPMQTQILEDIAVVTGATVINDASGFTIETTKVGHLGRCARITTTLDTTTIIGGVGEKEKIENRASELKYQLTVEEDPFMKGLLESRLAKLNGGAAVIYIGATTETEMNEKRDRIDDSTKATKAAIEEGIVPGGGMALIGCAGCLDDVMKEMTNDERIGAGIVRSALFAPFFQIIQNCGSDPHIILDKISAAGKGYTYGYNAKTEEYVDLIEAGVIDPTKVVRVALEMATSAAGMLLTSECLMCEVKEDYTPAI